LVDGAEPARTGSRAEGTSASSRSPARKGADVKWTFGETTTLKQIQANGGDLVKYPGLGPPFQTIDDRTWQHRASPLARVAWLAYGVLIVYASLAPWSGWRDLGVSPWAFLTAPLPRHITGFDVMVNVLGYLPFGAFGVLALHPRLRGVRAVLVATLVGLLLSAGIEALQTYLPRRVSSNVDFAANSIGGALGALLAAPFVEALIDRGRLAQLRALWFRRDVAAALVLLALWPVAQVHPGPMLFGTGEVQPTLDGIARLFETTAPQLGHAGFGPAEFVLAEATVTAAAVLAAGLTLAAIAQARAPRTGLLFALVVIALATRSLSLAVQFGPERALAWITPGAVGGLIVGLLALVVASAGAPRALLRLALLATVVLLVAVNIVPDNPYHASWLQEWRPGRLAHFSAAADWISALWPFALFVWLIGRLSTRQRSAGL
jgi:VanZ family protein